MIFFSSSYPQYVKWVQLKMLKIDFIIRKYIRKSRTTMNGKSSDSNSDSNSDSVFVEEALRRANEQLQFAQAEILGLKGDKDRLRRAEYEAEKALLFIKAAHAMSRMLGSNGFPLVKEAWTKMETADGNSCCWWHQNGGSSEKELAAVKAIWVSCQQALAKLDSVGK